MSYIGNVNTLVVHLTDINYTFFFYVEGSLNLIWMTFALTKPMLLYLRALGLEHANLEGKVLCVPSSDVPEGVRAALVSAEGSVAPVTGGDLL